MFGSTAPITGSKMAVAREPSPPIDMPHSIQSYQGSSADGGDNESVMSDLSWDGTPDENILSGSSRTATSLAIHEEDEVDSNLRFLDDPDGDRTLIIDDDEVYHQLADMEEKLKMAGEFGNALLEENQELRLMQQQIQQDTSAKIEALEQERHELRMKLETARSEKENVTYDLKMEAESLRKELASQDSVLKVANNNKQGIIGELMEQKEQNQKLLGQLQEVQRERDALHDRLKEVEKQNESISLFHHEASVGKSEQLRAEIVGLRAENGKLSERLITVSSEHETMMCNLEQAKERTMMLEKQMVELEQRLQFREAELRDLNRLHEETITELGQARSRANTHTSSLFDEIETAELTGYESSDEDLGADQLNGSVPRLHSGRVPNRQRSLVEELAEMPGGMVEPSTSSPTGGVENPFGKDLDLAEEFAEMNPAHTPRQRKSSPGDQRHRHMSLADEFAELENGGPPRRKLGSGSPAENSQRREMLSLADEFAGLNNPDTFWQQCSLSIEDGMKHQAVIAADECAAVNNSRGSGQGTPNLADELPSSSLPTTKLGSSSTLVYMASDDLMEEDRGMSKDSSFSAGRDEMIMMGIAMTSHPSAGMSLADELASTGYHPSYHGADEDDEGRSGEYLGRELSSGGLDDAIDEDDIEIINLETPKASPRRIPQSDELQIKCRQIEDVLHSVHVALAHIILELHSLVQLPLTDLGIMHASTVLHNPPNTAPHTGQTTAPRHPTIGSELDLEDDDDDSSAPETRSWIRDGPNSGLIGSKVKSQLNTLRSMLSIIVNGSPKMGTYQPGNCVVHIEEDEGGGRGLRGEMERRIGAQTVASHTSREDTVDSCISGRGDQLPVDKQELRNWQITARTLMDGRVRRTVRLSSGGQHRQPDSPSGSRTEPSPQNAFEPWS